MAILQEMESDKRPGYDDVKWFYSGEVTGGTSEPVRITNAGRDVYVVVDPGNGAARVETTASSYEKIESDQALWIPWQHGDITEIKDGQWVGGVSAMRLIATGTARWEIVK